MKAKNAASSIARLFASAAAGALLLGGCGLADEEAGALEPEAGVTEVQSALWSTWGDVTTPPFYANLLRGIALAANGTAYSWYSDGVACRGKATMLCTEEFEYSAPLNEFRYFLGMGMNAANHVYTWHDQLYYTIGDPANLTSRKSWGGGFSPAPFNASQMIGVFNINSGVFDPVDRWYFYFQEANNVVYRTIGTAGDADHYEGPKQVTISSQHGPILGIDYNRNNGRVYTWYKDGTLNSSTSTLNLAQN